MKSPEQTIRRLQRELKQRELKQKDTAIKQSNRAIKQKDTEISRREKTVGLLRGQLLLLLREDSLWAVTDAGRSDTDT